MRLVTLLVFIITLFASCGPDYIYSENIKIPNQEWQYDNLLNFTFDIQDTNRIYNLSLDITHSTDFPYQNIYTQIHTSFPSGEKIEERMPVNLADKSGKWYGQCSHDWCTLELKIQENAFFNALGNHTISIEQYMRVNPLPGIQSMTLKIEDTGVSRENN